MSGRTSFTQMLRDIDDAGLDVYEFRLWCHIWRVGVSWETVRTMANKCGMSHGKAAQAKKSLMDRSLLTYEERNGRLGLAAVICPPDGQTQHFICPPDGQVVHDMDTVVHHMDTVVHHMDAILSMPNEVSNMKGEGDRANGSGRPPASPPPIVIRQPADRTPGGNGYHLPEEPPVEKRPPSPEVVAVGEMCNAITDVTGISARLNWDVVSGLAGELVDAGYSPEQLRRHYSKQAAPGAWHWYEQDWRGKKGELPSVKAIRETIAGATQVAAAPKKIGQIERALAMFGNAPKPATQGG